MSITDEPITRDDIEDKLRALQTEVTVGAQRAKGRLLVVAAGAVVVVAGAAFLLGRRKGRRRTTVVEIKRV